MKQLKRFCSAALLTLALSITVFAGDIQGPAYTDPQPPDIQAPPTATIPAPRDVIAPSLTSTTDILTEFTLGLYVQLFSIF